MDTKLLEGTFTVDEYHQLAKAGVFAEDDRLELLDGEVVQMTPIGSRHAGCVNRLNRLFTSAAGVDAVVAVQNPVVCNDWTEFQPDLAILRPRADFYSREHPRPPDVYAFIEVADSSLGYDRGPKLRAYARAEIPTLVIIDLGGRAVAVYQTPAAGAYRQHDVLHADDMLRIPAVATADLKVGDLFD